MSTDADEFGKRIDSLLNLPDQMWLLGAGVSKNAGIPLMGPLTDRVEQMLADEQLSDVRAMREELRETAHVEHVLSHLGDLISMAERTNGRRQLLLPVNDNYFCRCWGVKECGAT